MSTQRERRAQKAREKKKKQRDGARRDRGSRPGRELPRRVSLETSKQWPLQSAWISQDWHERHARVTAVLTRRSNDGRIAAVVLEVDLGNRGITGVDVQSGVPEVLFQASLARLSEERALIEAGPGLVIRLAREGAEFTQRQGYKPPRELAQALVLLEGLEPGEDTHTLLWGDEPAREPESKKGLIGGLLGKLGLGS